jgi:hypothetical protein
MLYSGTDVVHALNYLIHDYKEESHIHTTNIMVTLKLFITSYSEQPVNVFAMYTTQCMC